MKSKASMLLILIIFHFNFSISQTPDSLFFENFVNRYKSSKFLSANYDSLLFQAVTDNNFQKLKAFIDSGSNINAVIENKGNLLMWCAYKSDLNSVKYLIEKGADYHQKNNIITERGFYGNLTVIAAGEGKLEMLKYFISELKIPVDEMEYDEETGGYGWSPIFWAINNGKIDIASYLIDVGANINSKDFNGKPLLNFALEKKQPRIAKLIIEKGADINVKDDMDETPLLTALYNKYTKIAKLLINKGAEVKITRKDGHTPLHWVTTAGLTRYFLKNGLNVDALSYSGLTPIAFARNKGIAKVLINNGANINTIDNEGRNVLFHQRKANIARILIKNGANVNQKNKNGSTPLYWADNCQFAKLLIKNGADMNLQDKNGESPLINHINNPFHDKKREKIAFLLISKGADIRLNNNYSQGPLHFAQTVKMIKLLMANGLSSEQRDSFGNIPLHFATWFDYTDVVEYYLSLGIDVNCQNNAANIPLHLAQKVEITSKLLAKGANLQATDSLGFSALYYAIKRSKFDIATLLLTKGYPINFANHNGQTNLILLTIKSEYTETIKFLLEHKADRHIMDNYGKTALDYAKELGKDDFASLLEDE